MHSTKCITSPSHHTEKTEAGLKGLYIQKITIEYDSTTLRITTL